MILLGEDKIDHTPRDEKLKLTVGYAFDIAAEEKVMNYEKISSQVDETTVAVEIRNHKNDDISVNVEKRLYGDWKILDSNYEYVKKDANTVTFKIPVKANEKATLSFTVRSQR